MSAAGTTEMTNNRAVLIQQAFRLEYITLAGMTIEAAVAIGSGVAADSLILTAFGIDSLIELASATVLVWRLVVELRNGQTFAENAERTASRIGGALRFARAPVAGASAGWETRAPHGGRVSRVGLIISGSPLSRMYFSAPRQLQP